MAKKIKPQEPDLLVLAEQGAADTGAEAPETCGPPPLAEPEPQPETED